MLNMNRATLLGHAGRDPEIRELNNGGRAATFTLATTEKWKDGEGNPVEATEWHRVVVYGPAVKAVEAMLKKGDRVMVEGRIATRTFSDREGTERNVTEIVVTRRQDTVNMLSARRAPADAAAGTRS
ncbi:MAG: single-stranded DNA-binding protein [Rhodospirillales bacterium]|nr:single-stranded DNA-binding protein [Rhodospirillales bacterium]MDE0378141.1 single-stranded DNA-binding protein [Rhodospirillales bacterium]